MQINSPIIGRDAELEVLTEAVKRVRAGRSHVVFLEGFAGVGKTRLLRYGLQDCRAWREISIILDQQHTRDDGYVLQRIVDLFGVASESLSIPELTVEAQRLAAAMRTPTVLTIANAHWLDDASAEGLLRLSAAIHESPVLLILSAQPTTRSSVSRLASFARSNLHGSYLLLEPYGPSEAKELLAEKLNTPIGSSVVQRVLKETAGYPLLISAVAEYLSRTPLGQRSLPEAFCAMYAGAEWQRMRRAVREILRQVDQSTAHALELVATAQAPLSRVQLEQAAGHPVDLAELLETGLVVWDGTRLGYTPRNRVVAQALTAFLSSQGLVRIHRELLKVVAPYESLFHRTEIVRLMPEEDEVESLTAERARAGCDALRRGEIGEALDHFLARARLRCNEAAVADLLTAAVPRGQLIALAEFELQIRNLPDGPLRAAGLAFLALGKNDYDSCVMHLEAVGAVDRRTPGALLFAEAVAEAGRSLGLRGDHQRLATAPQVVLEMLQDWQAHLQDIGAQTAVPSAAHEDYVTVGQLAGLHARIRLWEILENREPEGMCAAVGRITELLEGLQGLPGTELAQAELRVGRASRNRQSGRADLAYADLSRVDALPPEHGIARYADLQRALVLHAAGYWEEALQVMEHAASRGLLGREDSSILTLYAAFASLLQQRGLGDRIAALIDEIALVKVAHGAIVSSASDWARVCKADWAQDQEEALRLLARMCDSSGSRWELGLEPILLYARAAHYSGAGTVISQLRQRIERGEVPTDPEMSALLTAWLCAYEHWSMQEPLRAWSAFTEVLDTTATLPGIRPGQPDGGGFRVLRGYAALDRAMLLSYHPEMLGEYLDTAVNELEWALVLYRSIGASHAAELTEVQLKSLARRREPDRPGEREGSATVHEAPPSAVSISAGESPRADTGPVLWELSKRERQVAMRIAAGETNKEIARGLGVSVRTVDYHVSNVLTKLGLGSRRQVRQIIRSAAPGMVA
ncbi:LuxR C-terminal-related transcriptional regulator [Nesterenkonia rhizosphaerae]|uniref:HTH luxR-type domain-containing protein n=1 Tax=Nesterenkonia rhizosphaerae TaxID=1348272 RepID=A0ABP9FXL2_9MICC